VIEDDTAKHEITVLGLTSFIDVEFANEARIGLLARLPLWGHSLRRQFIVKSLSDGIKPDTESENVTLARRSCTTQETTVVTHRTVTRQPTCDKQSIAAAEAERGSIAIEAGANFNADPYLGTRKR
jgi:hypothetical protein